MSLKPESNLMLAAATGAVVYATYSLMLPTVADTRALPGDTPDINAAERNATFLAIGVVSGISLLAKSPEVFIVGGLMTLGTAWSYKNASHLDHFTLATRSLITPDSDHTPSGVTEAPKTTSQPLLTGSAF